LDRPALAPVQISALLAPPGIAGERIHFLVEGMIDRDSQPVLIHAMHHPPEIGAVIRPPLQNIVLPLMDDFMRERGDQFALAGRAVLA
jgi:hypothetical protein